VTTATLPATPKAATCGCAGCKAGLQPFTVDHFQLWAAELTLDNGRPWIVEPFFLAFSEDVFAGYDPDNVDAPKTYGECWLLVGEGNTKTTGFSGLALYHSEHRYAASVPWAASSRDQAEIGFRQAEGFVLRSPRLRAIFKCLGGFRRINNRVNGSRIQVFPADDRTGDGVIPTLAILDELHRHRSMGLYRTWAGKLDKRGAQLLVPSTAGEPGAEFEETRQRIRQEATEVDRHGVTFTRAVKGRTVLHDWAVPEDGDAEDLDLVKAANPFSGITVESLRKKRDSPSWNLPHWRRFVCNLPTRSERAAVQESEWFDAATDEEIPAGVPVWLGLDVAWKWDTTGMVPLWVPMRRQPNIHAVTDGEPAQEPRPPQPDPAADFLDRLNVNEGEYRLFGPATILEPPRDGRSLNPEAIERALVLIHQRNPLDTVVMDTSQAQDIAFWIESELGARVVERPQSPKFFADDYERFMEALRNGWLHHSGDVGLTRHVLNAVTHIMPYGDARFDRPSQTRRGGDQDRRVIDALTAASMVHAVAAAELGDGREPLVAWA
jgi:phage terminase large subunit-like protein